MHNEPGLEEDVHRGVDIALDLSLAILTLENAVYGILSLHRGVFLSLHHEFFLLLFQTSEDLVTLLFVLLASVLLKIVFSLRSVPAQELILF